MTTFVGCATAPSTSRESTPPAASSVAGADGHWYGTTGRSGALTAKHVTRGIELVRAGDLTAAAREFGVPLRYDPQNSYLRFLHGFTLHLLAERAAPERYEEARIGYELALQFDPGNWLAAQQLARLSLSCRDFQGAREGFAHALLHRPADPGLLFGLAQASYYLGDMETALAAISRAVELQPQSPEINAAHAIIAAAAGHPELARRSLQTFRKGDQRHARLEGRIQDWALLHTQAVLSADDGGASMPVPTPLPDPGPAPEPPAVDSRMVVVDVVMIRTEENETSHKGLNVLENLSLTFAGKYTPPQNRMPGASRWSWSDVVLANQPSINELRYSLDIFNVGEDRTEVLAMPTLIALDGRPSSMFAGLTLNVAVRGLNAGSISALDAGITLEVLPTFLPDGTVQLHVLARRTFVEEGAVGSFDEAVRTSKNEVSAEVILEFGQTLVLGGLREKQTTGMKSGVPLLRDLPVVQYAFSREKTSDFHKSILFLLTPRKVTPGMFRSPTSGNVSNVASTPGQRQKLDEFRRRHGYIFELEPNLTRIMRHLDKHKAVQEVRSADFFDRQWWGDKESVDVILKRAASFLIY